MIPINNDTIKIRRAQPEDVARIVELIMLGAARDAKTPHEIAVEAGHPAYREAFAEIAKSPHNLLFVAERGVVVGTYQLTLIPGLVARGRKRGKIESVHVAPEYRGQGIGAVMMRHAIDTAKAQGIGLVELTSDKARTDAHRFYVNLGFAQSHEGFKFVIEP
ncbi:GNAT family N-acetyltransferase [Bosea psychrotolerans]|uniref:Ribosomal protein S18 acetylase RimI-like enzyme n=1 Tax=Bosea psychrotolerans TaxID=1871628 RepID=A0A2S4LZG3_9HYPH|nr:GNAT family N-acetyltransferase [Bosea psychrotolerans]POR47850.1 ribosomal protein S18 acetylase RimI-like enzyme [Bosea psychrotolerans]